MAEKQPTNKQSRHQSAKTKYQHYHRVLSCKNLMKNVAPITPSPGQFIVENNKPIQLPTLTQSKSYSLLLTKNIRNIVQKTNPVPFNEMLSQVVLKKNLRISANNERNRIKKEVQMKNRGNGVQNQPYFKRPISAKIYHETQGKQVQDSQMLKQAFDLDRQIRKHQQSERKNYFQVKSKQRMPKHIHGYNTIVLQERSELNSKATEQQLREDQIQKQFDSLGVKFDKSFLPTEYYFNQHLKPEELINKYKNENGVIFGFSKWFHNDGKISWKKCHILSYNQAQERWQIQWLGSGITKKVSRNNLYFEKENFHQFEKKLESAQDFRKRTQIYMKYNMLINLISTPTSNLSEQIQQKVKSLISYDFSELKSCQYQLFEDVKKLYVRACHQFEFNLALPYSTACKKMFGGVLPDQMFDPNPRKMMIQNSNKLQPALRRGCSQIFELGLKKMKQKCFLNSEKKIQILQLINVMSEELSSIDLLKDYKKFEETSYTVQQVEGVINRNISQYLYKITCRICDIEHNVSKELDPIYTNKKFIPEQTYNSTMARYQKFLLLANMKIQSLLRQSANNIIKTLSKALPSFKHCKKTNSSEAINWDVIFLQEKLQLKIKVETSIKQDKLEITPKPCELSATILNSIQRMKAALKSIKCISKTYLPEIRPGNLLQIINPNFESQQISIFQASVEELKMKVSTIEQNFSAYIASLAYQVAHIFQLNSEISKKLQKKNSYTDIQEFVEKISQCEEETNKMIRVQAFNLCGIFIINFGQIKTKIFSKISEAMKYVVNLLLDKIYKDNQKMQKNVASVLETLLKVPNTISQFVELEAFVAENVKQEIQKVQSKAKMLAEKMNLLEKTNQTIEFKQFENCCQIYLKPLKLKKAREDVLYKLENVYKKNFAEELMKESFSVLDNIRICEKKFGEIFQSKTLQEMDRNFNFFSELSSNIQSSCQKMSAINQKENLLKWSKTNFDRLLEVKQSFQPYYKLITLHKNYRLNLLPLLDEAFTQINYQIISSNVSNSFETLKYLHNHVFNGNPIYEPITQSILKQYEQFNSYLPLIKALRNPDLRERHWVIIQNITGIQQIRGDQITLKQILGEEITIQSQQLFKISQIATKELIYEKSLNQLKREWKDVRITMKEIKIGNESFKIIKNLGDVQKKIENDMLEVNNILASSFIKFLETDVTHWKSSVLEKVYEFINFWPGFESKIIFYLRLINSSKISEYFQNITALQKNFQKFWKQFMNNVQYQSLVVDIVCSRTWESINSLEFQMEEIQRIISQFLEEKKKMNSKLRLFSDDALISMMVESSGEANLESMRKCFSGAKSLKFIQQFGSQNIEIKSMLDEKIVVTLQDKSSKTDLKTQKSLASKQVQGKNPYQFDQLLFSIDRQLKKQIRTTFLSSLQHEIRFSDLLCQVQLLRCRLIFKNKVEQALLSGQNLDKYELEMLAEQQEYIANIKNNCQDQRVVKVCSLHIIEIINELNVIQNLNQTEDPLSSFEWYKYPKYELADLSSINNPKLKFVLGTYTREYLFELTECQSFLVNPFSDTVFLNVCTALSDRMLPMLEGRQGSSRSMHLQFLGQLMGRNVTQINCCESTSAANLRGYLKIASSGLFIVLSEMQKLSVQCISAFNQTLSTFWVNYQLSRANINSFPIGSDQIVLDVPNFTLVGICEGKGNLHKENYLKECFRTFSVVPIQQQFLLKCALLSVGIREVDQSFLNKTKTILGQLNYEKAQNNLIRINNNHFIRQLSQQFLQLYSQTAQNDRNQGQLLQDSLEKVVQMFLPFEQNKTSQIWKNLVELGLINKKKNLLFKKIEVNFSQNIKKNSQTEQVETNSQKSIEKLKKLLQFHCGVIVTGRRLSGKTAIINSLFQQESDFKYNFSSVNSLAYTTDELFEGNSQKLGIIRQMIQQIKVKASGFQLHFKVVNGLYFDCQIGPWAEPLLSIVNKPSLAKISCYDGTLLTLPQPMKLIFETQSIKNMPPNYFHSLGIFTLPEEIKWKQILNNLFDRYFSNNFSASRNAVFIKCLLDQTFDSIIQFYQSINATKTSPKAELVVICKPILLESLIKFFSIIYHKEDVQIIGSQEFQAHNPKQLEERTKSEIFNIYTYSIVGTLGLLIPEQSRKTFSRHFKYVLQQSHLGRYGWKNSNILSKEDENIYDFIFENGQWRKWRCQRSLYTNESAVFQQYRVLQNVLRHHIQHGNTCFLLGDQCSSKNYLFKNYISELKTQKYTKNYFTCSSLTKKFKISDRIEQMIHTEKYSRKINGFSNCKRNLFYIQDLNMGSVSQSFEENGSIIEFMKQFYRKNGWYINGSFYSFSNLAFYGTLRQNLKLPTRILRYLNPILIGQPQNRIQSILQSNIKSSPISAFQKQLLIRCTLNLQDVITRDFAQSCEKDRESPRSLFNLRDMVRVVRGVSKITENIFNPTNLTMHSLLRFWVYVVDKVYSQKISSQKKSFLFYHINNVLMEQERVRYRTICPSSDFYILGFRQSSASLKNLRQTYETASIDQLTMAIRKLAQKSPEKYRYISVISTDQLHEMIKIMVKIANSFEFESKIVIIMNEQKRTISSILKMLGLVSRSMLFEAQRLTVSQWICPQQELSLEKSLNHTFTKAYFQNFDVFQQTSSKFSSAFQSHLQSKNNIQNQFDETKANENKDKNRVIYHIKNFQPNAPPPQSRSNFVLEDLLSYKKINRLPKWMIPKQESYEDLPQLTEATISNRKKIFQKYLSNRDSQEIYKEMQQKQQRCKNMDINVVLEYYKMPDYLFKYYMSLVDESSLVFLRNPSPESAAVAKTSKIIMTDVKYEEQLDEDVENLELRQCSAKELQKLAAKFGPTLYIDLINDIFVQYANQNWATKLKDRPLAFRNSFRNVFNKVFNDRKQRNARKSQIEQHIKRTETTARLRKQKLASDRMELTFILTQNNLRLEEVKSKIEKEEQKYMGQKNKLAEIQQKIQKKQSEYEQNLRQYRHSMDKHSFEFSKAKEKLVKAIILYQSGKLNIANELSIENKLLIEALSCALSLVDTKKNEDATMLALRQFTKLLKEKKISKFISKASIESIPLKASNRIQKIIQQLQSVAASKKLQNHEPTDNNFKRSIQQFLCICLIGSKQFANPKVKQNYENIQSAGRTLEKLKTQQTKKEKSKANKQLFENYNTLSQEHQKLQLKSKELTNQVEQMREIQNLLQELLTTYLPIVQQAFKKQSQKSGEGHQDVGVLITSLCLRYFNELYGFNQCELTNLFKYIEQNLARMEVPFPISCKENLEKLNSSTVVNSIFNFRGFVLLQTRTSKFCSRSQNQAVIEDLFFHNQNFKKLSSNQYDSSLEMSPILAGLEPIVVEIEQTNQRQCYEMVGKITSEEIDKLVIICSPYFTEEQKCNFPYIDFVTGLGATLGYQYVYDKCKSFLFQKNNKIFIPHQQEHVQSRSKTDSSQLLLRKFMKFNMEGSQELLKIKQNCLDLYQAFRPVSNQQARIEEAEKPVQKEEILIQSNLTDKQKQKQFLEDKTAQFFSKLYLILHYLHRNGKPCSISLQYYLESVQRIIKSSPHCNIVTNTQWSCYKYLGKINQELSDFTVPIQITLLCMIINNGKMGVFGNMENYQRYVEMLIKQICSSSEGSENNKDSVLNAIQKLKLSVPPLASAYEEITFDYEFWVEDVNTIYKEEKEPPVQWLYLMLVAGRNRFWELINKFEKKTIEKLSADPQFLQTTLAQQKLVSFLSAPRGSYSLVTPVFITSPFCLHQIVTFVENSRVEYEFIDIIEIVSKHKSHSTKSPTEFRKSQKMTPSQIEILIQANKLLITFIQESQLAVVGEFIELVHSQTQAKRLKASIQEELPQIKLIIINRTHSHQPTLPPAKNALSIKQTNSHYLNLQCFCHHLVKYYSTIAKDKIKHREYEQLSAMSKRSIYEIFIIACEAMMELSLQQEFNIAWTLRRCWEIVEKIGKPKNANSKSELPLSWKLLIKQILYEHGLHQQEIIASLMKKAEDESIKIAEESCKNRYHSLIKQSSTYKKMHKIVTRHNTTKHTTYFTSSCQTPPELESLACQFARLHSHIQCQAVAERINAMGIQIEDFIYVLRRKYANERQQPLQAVVIKLQLMPYALYQHNSHTLPDCRIRLPLSLSRHQFENKPYVLQVSAGNQPQRTKWSKTKGILIGAPFHRLYDIHIKEEMFLSNYITYGMGQSSYIVDHLQPPAIHFQLH